MEVQSVAIVISTYNKMAMNINYLDFHSVECI